MNRRRRTLPPVPPKAPSELRPLIAAMTEILETGEGVRGDPLDRKVTLRDLLDSGIGKLKPGMRPGQDGNLDSGALPAAPDLSIPPAPANFDAQGGFYGMINLSWTIPGQQYRNHAYTNIFRSEEDNFANAEVIGREAGGFYTDYVRDDAVDPDDPTKLKGYYYWITFTSVADVEGPPNSPNGTYAAPLADLGYVIELLTGEIDAGVLAQSLREEIEKIPAIESNIERIEPIETAIERIGPIETAIERLDPIETAIERIGPIEAELRGPESLDGSVANRIAAERDARIQAVDNERAERVDSLLAEQQERQDAISFEAQARQDAIQAEVQDRVAAVAAERDARVAALQAEQGARAAAITSVEEQLVDGDTALASQLTTLTAVVDGNSADISNEQQARVSGDEALASDITTLQIQVGDNEAAIINESQARIENDALRASQLAVIAATYNANTASIYSLEEIRIGDREATATRINGLEVQVEDNEASIFQEQIARANADSALASQLSVLSAKIDALPTFANGFESGLEFDRWVAASGHSITAETNDAFSGDQSALVSSTSNSVATSSAPFAVSARIPNGTADAFAGRRVRVGIAARAVSGGSAEFAIGYATSDGWFSGWHRHEPAAGWGIFEAQVEVPEVANEDHYVVVWGDTSGGGGSVEVDRLLIDVADTEIPEITAQIETLQQAIADNQQAMATQFNALSSQFDTSIATVNGELTALSTADVALASSIQTLQAEIDNNAAAIVDEQTARATETDALAQQLNAVDARVDQSRALITSEAQSRADEDNALAQQINAVDARVDGSRSLITSEQQARADADSALASDIQALTAVTGGLAADIQSESTVRASADEALAEDVTDLWAGVGENEARITDESRVRATEDDLLAAVQRVISASRGTASATFYSLDEVRLEDSAATALRIDGVEVQLADAFSAIELEQSLRASEDQALATQITTAVAELDGDISTVQQTLTTEVTRLDSRVDATAQLVTAVQSQLDSDLSTVQQNFETEVSRIDEQLSINAQAITDVQASTDDALSAVQQDFNAQTSYLDERINSNAQALTEVRSDLEGDVSGVQQNLNTQVSRLDGRVDSTAQALTTVQSQLEEELSTVQQDFNTEVSRLDGRVDSTAQAITNVQSASEEALAGVQQDFNTEVSFLKNEQAVVSAVYKASAQSITAVQAGFENNLATVQQSLTTDVTRLDGRIDSQAQALTTVQSQLERDITTVQQNFNTAVTRLDGDTSANAQAITDVQSAMDDALAGVQQDFNTEVTRLDGRIDVNAQAVTEVRSDLEGDVAGVQQNLNTQVSRLDGRVDSAAQSISTVQSQLSGDISTVQQNLNTNVNRIDDELNANAQAITDVQSGTDDALAGVQQDFNTEIARVDEAIDANANAITEVRSDLGSDIAAVQQSLSANVSRLDGDIANNAQSITTVQSQLGSQLATVQQDFSSEIARVDGDIEATAQLVQSVQTDLGDGLNAVEIKAVSNSGSIITNGNFATGDLSGWDNDTWTGIRVIERNEDSGFNGIRTAPSKYFAAWDNDGFDSTRFMRSGSFAVKSGEAYVARFSYAVGSTSRDITFALRVMWEKADGSTAWNTLYSGSATSLNWDGSGTISFTAPSDAVAAYLYFRRWSGGTGALYIANVVAHEVDMVAGSLYTAKVQSGGLIGGFGLYNDGDIVEAGFDVDRFWIGRTNSDKRKPFIIDDDVIYMNNAMIRNGSIQEGQLGPITIGKFFLDDGTPVTTAGGLIRAEAIDVDNLSVAEAARFYADVQSGNYIAGSRGWRIRQNGDVEFNQGQFNGTVNVGNVSGLGSLATQNDVDYSALKGSKPPANADHTGSNVAADTQSVAGWDANTVRDMANRGNLAHGVTNGWTRPSSTLIDGNKIYTGDAYVDTLQIKGQAVTLPLSAYTNGNVGLSSQWTWYTVQELHVPDTGMTMNYVVTAGFRGEVSNVGEDVLVDVELTYTQWSGNLLNYQRVRIGSGTEHTPITLSRVIETRNNGGGTIRLRVRRVAGATPAAIGQRLIEVLGAKR
ncbi:hypothetical protein Q8G38_00160 [Halomonas venusta]|uniref:phage tail tip fiber protein n=1 Tax=Vreelandella venusta TaxID=44935 RepID=UPI00295F4242|nr:hypothetical protein [Halomonas venusta]MDW0357722.1 hypothetical protein [Halomonas venusta]